MIKKILHLLQENARYPLKHLASKVFLSSPAVSARIERLEKSGIISGYHASVAPVSLGYHITAFINMALDPKRKPEFYPFIQACPNVLECNCVTGAYSMLIKVCFPSTMELDTFIGQLQKYGNTETQIVFSTPVPPRGIDVRAADEDEDEDGADDSCKIHGYIIGLLTNNSPYFLLLSGTDRIVELCECRIICNTTVYVILYCFVQILNIR